MKKYFILFALFILPIVAYLFFASGINSFAKLPTITEKIPDITEFKTADGKTVSLDNKITILGFTGSNIIYNEGNFFNLNQKIYNKYKGFTDFQMVMVTPKGNEAKAKQIIDELAPITGEMTGWKFVFASPEEIQSFYDSYKLTGKLDENLGTPAVIIVDKELNHRGRKGKNKKGVDEYKESYNTISAADLHNEMTDDIKIILREYRLALKKNKNKRKDAFRDKIEENVSKANKNSNEK